MSQETKCSGCQYWQKIEVPENYPDSGECHFYPPSFHPMNKRNFVNRDVPNGAAYGDWPITMAKEWCGQFKAKPSNRPSGRGAVGKPHPAVKSFKVM